MKRVIHIKEMTGARGGKFWVLTLDCGHLVTRPQPQVSYADMVRVRAWKRFTAPHRARCYVCSPEEIRSAPKERSAT